MAEEKKDSRSKVIIIVLIAVVAVLLIAGAIIAVLLLQNNNNAGTGDTLLTSAAVTSSGEKNPLILDYDGSAVALDADDLNKQINDMQQKVDAGQISLEYQNIAFSENGTDFSCHLANSDMNTEDMFIAVYKDATYSERLYLSGLLAPGTVINNFKSDIHFEPGDYETVAVFTTVADDHNTMTGQISVVLKITVG